jgi:hypothetical protein
MRSTDTRRKWRRILHYNPIIINNFAWRTVSWGDAFYPEGPSPDGPCMYGSWIVGSGP